MNDLAAALAQAGIVSPEALSGADINNVDLTPPAFLQRQKPASLAVDTGLGAPQPTTPSPTPAPEPEPAQVIETRVPVPPEPTPAPEPEPEPEPTTPPADDHGSNQPGNPSADKARVLRNIGKLGEDEGRGANARPAFFEQIAEAARLGALMPDDAPAVFSRYTEGVAKAKGVGVVKQTSEAQQTSKIKTMITFGALPSVRSDVLLANTRDAIKKRRDAGEKLKKSPVDIYLTVARTQLAQPQTPLDDDQIDECLNSKAPEVKTEADRLDAIAQSMDKLLNSEDQTLTDETVQALNDAMPLLLARVAELGGTTKEKAEQARLDEKQKKLDEAKAKAGLIKRV